MPWFYCDSCGDTVKKAKVSQHSWQCRGATFTCIDCSRSFDAAGTNAHVTCVTEHEKYALGATKPGGYASSGFADGAATQGGPAGWSKAAGSATGKDAPLPPEADKFLASRPPWSCSLCNTACTSRSALEGHALGAKHRRRARAALAAEGAAQGEGSQDATTSGEATEARADAAGAGAKAGEAQMSSGASSDDASEAKESVAGGSADGKNKKKKKYKEEDASSPKKDGKVEKTKKRSASEAGVDDSAAGADEEPACAVPTRGGKALKWRKLAATEIEKAGGRLKLKHLVASLVALVDDKDFAGDSLRKLLEASKRFKVQGGRISVA